MTSLGDITRKGFVMPIRVYYADTDAGGIVYHANYLKMAETCRSELLRAFGAPLVGDHGENFVVKRAEIDWVAPARLDDLLICSTRIGRLGAAKILMKHQFEIDGRTLCNIDIELVHVSKLLKPMKIYPELRKKFAELLRDAPSA